MTKVRVCAIIPCYNEERFIYEVTKTTQTYVDGVIVVDDGSTDKTFAEAKKTGAIVLSHPTNQGKGEALRTGIEKALEEDYDLIVTLDGDQQHPPDLIPRFVTSILEQKVDIVIGSRFLQRDSKMPWLRILTNKTTTNILKHIFGIPITDSQSGYRIFRKEVLQKVHTTEKRYVMETEILIEAHRNGFTIGEVHIPVIYGTETSKQVPLREFSQWVRLAWRKLLHRKPLQKN